MPASTLHAAVVGAMVGAAPYWVLPLHRWPAAAILCATAGIVSATAYRRPVVWVAGVIAGAAGSWAALAVIGLADWRLFVYVPLAFETYYVTAVVGLALGIAGAALRHRRVSPR